MRIDSLKLYDDNTRQLQRIPPFLKLPYIISSAQMTSALLADQDSHVLS
jgi:hypothetical protein